MRFTAEITATPITLSTSDRTIEHVEDPFLTPPLQWGWRVRSFAHCSSSVRELPISSQEYPPKYLNITGWPESLVMEMAQFYT